MTQGTIQFRVFTSSSGIPVEDATVVIREYTAPNRLLWALQTDASGMTEPVTIATPELSLGLRPQTTEKPWADVRVLVDHPDYDPVFFVDVQVFPGILTVQNVQLLPLSEGKQETQETFSFPPQRLWKEDQHE